MLFYFLFFFYCNIINILCSGNTYARHSGEHKQNIERLPCMTSTSEKKNKLLIKQKKKTKNKNEQIHQEC